MPVDDMIRASDADREHTVAVLCEGYTAGRLTLAEFDDRTTAAFTSRTWGELRQLTRDLPPGPVPAGHHPPSGRPGTAGGRAPHASCPGTAPVLLLVLFWLVLSVAAHAAGVLIPVVLVLLMVVWSAARFRRGLLTGPAQLGRDPAGRSPVEQEQRPLPPAGAGCGHLDRPDI